MHVFKNRFLYLYLFSTILFLCVPNVGYCECNGQPQYTIKQYYAELAQNNLEKALMFVVTEDRKEIKEGRLFEEPYCDLLAAIYKLTTVEIINSTLVNDRAELLVKLRTPNYGGSLGANIAESIGNIDDVNISPETVWQKTLHDIKRGNFEYVELEKEMILICEENSWRIFLDAKKVRKIRDLTELALQAVTNKRFDEATSYFNQILDIDKNNKLASVCLERIRKAEGSKENQPVKKECK